MVVVHGCEVPFNAQKINDMFSLKDNPDAEGNHLIASTSHERMQNVVQVIAKPGSKWETSPTRIKTLPSKCLLPEANLQVYFVKKRLILTMHDALVSRDQVMVAYCIMQYISLDVSCIIAAQV